MMSLLIYVWGLRVLVAENQGCVAECGRLCGGLHWQWCNQETTQTVLSSAQGVKLQALRQTVWLRFAQRIASPASRMASLSAIGHHHTLEQCAQCLAHAHVLSLHTPHDPRHKRADTPAQAAQQELSSSGGCVVSVALPAGAPADDSTAPASHNVRTAELFKTAQVRHR